MAAIAIRLDTAYTRERDGVAFEQLFNREYPSVVSIARRILFDAHLAEDVAQDVFVSFHRLHPPDAPYAARWLHVASAHAALNVLRGRKRRERREIADALAARPSETPAPDPAAAIADAELRDRVRGAVRRIGRKHAAVLAMRHAGLSYAEIAAALRVGANQVGTLLRRAEVALKKEIENGTSR